MKTFRSPIFAATLFTLAIGCEAPDTLDASQNAASRAGELLIEQASPDGLRASLVVDGELVLIETRLVDGDREIEVIGEDGVSYLHWNVTEEYEVTGHFGGQPFGTVEHAETDMDPDHWIDLAHGRLGRVTEVLADAAELARGTEAHAEIDLDLELLARTSGYLRDMAERNTEVATAGDDIRLAEGESTLPSHSCALNASLAFITLSDPYRVTARSNGYQTHVSHGCPSNVSYRVQFRSVNPDWSIGTWLMPHTHNGFLGTNGVVSRKDSVSATFRRNSGYCIYSKHWSQIHTHVWRSACKS